MTTPLLGSDTWRVDVADCRDGIATLPADAVDMFATSAPYAQGLEYEQGLDWDGLRALMGDVARLAIVATKPSGWFWCNFGETTKYPRTMAELYNEVFREAGWIMHSRRIWAKSFAACKCGPAMINNTKPTGEWEFIWTFRKPPNTKEVHRDRRLSYHGVWKTSGGVDVARDEHPAVYPVALPAMAIKVWTDPGDLVVDPFCGSGSTGVAAVQMGRRFIGFELCERYADFARKRIGGAQPPLFTEATA